MKVIKFILPILLVFFSTTQVSAQIYRFKADSYSVMEKKANGKWGNWTDFNNTPVLISIDGKKNRIIINSKEIQLYTILSFGEKIVDNTKEILPIECADNSGGLCRILIVTKKNEDNRKQFYINYDDIKIVYNVFDVQ